MKYEINPIEETKLKEGTILKWIGDDSLSWGILCLSLLHTSDWLVLADNGLIYTYYPSLWEISKDKITIWNEN